MDILQRLQLDPASARQISPTDLSQYIRLEQCQRYLRLRLTERANGTRFLREYGVTPQSIPPLLTRSGAGFEVLVTKSVGQHFPVRDFASGRTPGASVNDNEEVVRLARELVAGAVLVLFQPRLQVDLGPWRVRGDVDILRLERDQAGALSVHIADMKSSTAARVEHRLQVAFYLEMLEQLLRSAAVPVAGIEMGILYRGPAAGGPALPELERAKQDLQRKDAVRLFGVADGLLEIVEDPDSYRSSVRDLVTGPQSTATKVVAADFEDLFYHLSYKCDGCLYNEFCMKWSAEHDDLSLLPHLLPEEKTALQRGGVRTMQQLALLKDLPAKNASGPATELVAEPTKEPLVRQLAATWPVGPRLDELIHRARRYRKMKQDPIEALSFIPSKGYGSLPYADAQQNPNLVRVYIDAQHDYLQDRIYLLGALVVGSEDGKEPAARRRSIVELSSGPPDTLELERDLFIGFAQAIIRAVVEVAAPDANGERNAPVHLIFFNRFDQRLLLDGLSRHLTSILEATPLYDFVTQLAAFDSPLLTYLDQEIRELKNYPMVCQSLQAVASYLKFDWKQPQPYSEVFRTRMFDYWNKFDAPPAGREESLWYTGRARFNSQIPLEYAYAAWGELTPPALAKQDEFSSYRAATPELLRGFQERRLEALEWVAKDFAGNKQTVKTAFALPDLARFTSKAQTLAQALNEFITIERHSELADWKTARLAPPERRVLAGDTLIVQYHEVDQDVGVAAQNRENSRRQALREAYKAGSLDGKLTKEQRKETQWSQDDMTFRLRLICEGVDCGLEEVLALTTLREGERIVIMPRLTSDSRPGADTKMFTPTPKQLLYGTRADIAALTVQRDAGNAATGAVLELRMSGSRTGQKGFTFGSFEQPLIANERYTLDDDPNNWYGYFCLKVADGLCAGEHNVLYDRLTGASTAGASWPAGAAAGQRRFLAGLDAFQRAGALHTFEPSKREFIGEHGETSILLVQGPPGTGKSYSTAFVIFARLQGAMAADLDFRVIASCKTHAATDVLLKNIARVQADLCNLQTRQPELFARYLDPRLLTVPLYRFDREAPAEGIIGLPRKDGQQKGAPRAADTINGERWCITGAAPGGIYRLLLDRWNELFGHQFCDCLVLDEASQMNLPEALMAALPLKDDGQVIVVGDHRQMPPIVKHDWAGEPRRTFQEFRSYASLFETLLPMGVPMIKFAESFRLHADMAEFLRREIYAQDGIAYFSRQRQLLTQADQADPFIRAVLTPEAAIVVVVHDEEQSMLRNTFEQSLIGAIAAALTAAPYGLEARHGLGVVVPHRAQRAALQTSVPELSVLDPETGQAIQSAVDTVERFQGDERAAIVVGATESDPQYLLVSSEFLLDPRRLTVALSRARHKLILIAARSVFSLFATDEDTFANSQLWKHLLKRTCTMPLWTGERDGQQVEVWGNEPDLRSVT